jgi:serine/threonine protein kinase
MPANSTHQSIGGRYLLRHQIGRGGMGAVWLAVDEVLGREVAVKRIGAFPDGDTPGLVRAQREANLAARLNHPHVVAVFDFVTEGDEQWLVMEHVAGTDLATFVGESGALEPDEAAHLLGQVAEALTAAHEAGIVHRDVKPSNILLTPDGTAKLADFGIARARDSTLTASGMVSGSPAYLAPEVAAGTPATEASDVWSLGATLYQALAGRMPYDTSDNVPSTLYRIVHDPPPRLPGAGWPADLLEHTMTTDPDDRWPMRRVQQYLTAGPPPVEHDDSPTEMLAPAAPVEHAAPEHPRRTTVPVLPLLLGLLVLLLMAGVGWFAMRPDQEPSTTADDTPGRTPSTVASRTPSRSAPASTPATTPTTEVTPTPETPTSASTPTTTRAQAMKAFVEQYIQAALADPESSWNLLSPRFQQDCCDGDPGSYTGYWNTIADATLRDVVADPATMQVSYVITWDPAGERGPEDENVTLGLVQRGDGYLVDDEL